MSNEKDFSCYTFGEGITGGNQFVEFTCRPGEVENVKKLLKENIRDIDIPTTGRVNISHGGYGSYTRYDITQHCYSGGNGEDGSGGYFFEVLEIKNPPDGRHGIVTHLYLSWLGSVFTEWETLGDAVNVHKKHLSFSGDLVEDFKKLKGFKRNVVCGLLRPWFYAVGDEQLIGDYAFPEGLQDDPVYRFGQKFVVYDQSGNPSIKICMGTRFLKKKTRESSGNREEKEIHCRVVYWDDGSIWDEGGFFGLSGYFTSNESQKPRPLRDEELWIFEAMQEFKKLLAGQQTSFDIKFTNGNKFVGKLVTNKDNCQSPEGDYLVVANIEGENSKEGWVNDFKPTQENPNIVQYVINHPRVKDRKILSVKIKESKTLKNGRKWSGVFFNTK